MNQPAIRKSLDLSANVPRPRLSVIEAPFHADFTPDSFFYLAADDDDDVSLMHYL